MLTVYHAPRTRSFRVLWMLEEMGLPYGVRPVDFPRHRDDAEFMRLNPAGTMPMLTDGEVVITESAAILQYLADRHGPTDLVPSPVDQDYPAYLQYLHFGEASLAGPMTVVAYCLFYGPEAERENPGVEAARALFRNRLPLVERRLESHPYVVGDRFTAADISVAYALRLGRALGAVEGFAPPVNDYLARCRHRPAFQRAMKV
jgi:glutathione S-transferase